VLQAAQNRATNNAQHPGLPGSGRKRGRTWLRRQRPEWGRRHMDLVTIAVIGVIVISYLVGSLTSSVETEEKLPHRY